ncbi:Uncharacterized protein Fot_52295 [Forsythia ovata]|uniref:Uncharacterized protein n=1 Tax=Forsythia ovata TaxID=205694 RepID=A0ABD1PL43_9LAMI
MELYGMLPENGFRAAAARRPNLPLISPPIPCTNRISRRSNTRDFELNQTTLRKTAEEKGAECDGGEKGAACDGDRNRGERRPATETGASGSAGDREWFTRVQKIRPIVKIHPSMGVRHKVFVS